MLLRWLLLSWFDNPLVNESKTADFHMENQQFFSLTIILLRSVAIFGGSYTHMSGKESAKI